MSRRDAPTLRQRTPDVDLFPDRKKKAPLWAVSLGVITYCLLAWWAILQLTGWVLTQLAA